MTQELDAAVARLKTISGPEMFRWWLLLSAWGIIDMTYGEFERKVRDAE